MKRKNRAKLTDDRWGRPLEDREEPVIIHALLHNGMYFSLSSLTVLEN